MKSIGGARGTTRETCIIRFPKNKASSQIKSRQYVNRNPDSSIARQLGDARSRL